MYWKQYIVPVVYMELSESLGSPLSSLVTRCEDPWLQWVASSLKIPKYDQVVSSGP